jgi:hypothetical protein
MFPCSRTATLAGLITHKIAILIGSIFRLSRVAVLGNSEEPANAQTLKETARAAELAGVTLQYIDVWVPKEIESAFQATTTGCADAVLVVGGYVFTSQMRQLAEYAIKSSPSCRVSGERVCRRGWADILQDEHC